MISFIVIGKNEAKTLRNCFNSIYKAVAHNRIADYEIIYVDSKSTDNSIDLTLNYPDIACYQITGKANAAVARNIGFKESSGEILFFIDGDMVIEEKFLSEVFENGQLKYSFVSGQVIDHIYSSKWEKIKEAPHYKSHNNDTFTYTTGGVFLIKREVWALVNGMRNKYKRSQDVDFALRLAKKGVYLLRKKEVVAYHHTIPHSDNFRMWNNLRNGYQFYERSLVYRENIFNIHIYDRILKNDYTALSIVGLLGLSIFINNYLPLLLYAVLNMLRSKFSLGFSINLLLRDISSLLGFFFFFPRDFKIEYNKYNKNKNQDVCLIDSISTNQVMS